MKIDQTLSPDIHKKIKEIEIHTRRLLRNAQIGDARSALKGIGFEFDQIREYQRGDDVRFIDWNASARMDTLLVKQYREERSRTVMLAVDISASNQFGSIDNLKHDTLAQIASVLALVTNSGKDRIGLILFSDIIEEYIPPSRGNNHVQLLMEKVFTATPQRKTTNINTVFQKIATLKYRDIIGFIISDFIDDQVKAAYVAPLCKKHDIIGIRCLDQHEKTIPPIGFLSMQDKETGQSLTLDLRKNEHVVHFFNERIIEQNKFYKRNGMRLIDTVNNDTFIGDLIRFFRRRMRY